jgi:hypothetical protein
VLTYDQAEGVLKESWLAANGSPFAKDLVPAAGKMQNRNYRFLAYRWIAFWVQEQNESLHGQLKMPAVSGVLRTVWTREK